MKEQFVQEPLAGLSEILQPPAATDRFVLAEGWIETNYSQVPIAVELGKRVAALTVIDGYFAGSRRVQGSEWAVRDQNSQFSQRYGAEALRVHQNAKRNLKGHVAEFRTAVDVLAAADALRANGQSEQDVWMERMKMQIEVNRALR